jgi:hypothetical protein
LKTFICSHEIKIIFFIMYTLDGVNLVVINNNIDIFLVLLDNSSQKLRKYLYNIIVVVVLF